MGKRGLNIILCVILAAVLFCGCGVDTFRDEDLSDTEYAENGEDAAEKIVLYSLHMGSVSEYLNVQDAINAVTIPEIGVEVEMVMLDMSQWLEKFPVILSGAEEADLFPLFYDSFVSDVSKGYFSNLNDLLDCYGSDILACIDDIYLSCTSLDDVIYAVPSFYEFGYYIGFEYDVQTAEELGLGEEIETVRTVDDWTAVLEKVHEAYPDMRAFVSNGGNTLPNYNYSSVDDLGDYLGTLDIMGDSSEIINMYETEEYYNFCKTMESWYDAGYISADEIIDTDTFDTVCASGDGFSTLAVYHMTSKEEYTSAIGREVDFAPLYDGTEFMKSNILYVWSIPDSSEHKEAAMKFLNLLYSDSELESLYLWGVEGENYQITDEGFAAFPDGESADSAAYHPNLTNVAPNHYIALLWEGETHVSEEDIRTFNAAAKFSPATGFLFDNTNVEDEVTACSAVLDYYRVPLEKGAVDVDEVLPEFLQALDDAGIDKIIAEKQRQLDGFLAD